MTVFCSNTALIQFAKCTGGSNTATHFGIGTESSGAGILLYSAPIGTYRSTFQAVTSDTFYASEYAFSDGNIVRLDGLSLPTGVDGATKYYVVSASGNTFKLSLTLGGAAVNLTSVGFGRIYTDGSLAISNNIQPQFNAGELVVRMSGDASDSWVAKSLALMFNNSNATGIGDAGGLLGSVVAGSHYISLHTASPGASGSQTTNECDYDSVNRPAVARSAGGWTIA